MIDACGNAAADDPADTDVVKWLMQLTPGERIGMAGALNELARDLLAEEIRERHPEWSRLDVQSEVARRFLTDENLPELYAKDSLRLTVYRSLYERFLADRAAGADR